MERGTTMACQPKATNESTHVDVKEMAAYSDSESTLSLESRSHGLKNACGVPFGSAVRYVNVHRPHVVCLRRTYVTLQDPAQVPRVIAHQGRWQYSYMSSRGQIHRSYFVFANVQVWLGLGRFATTKMCSAECCTAQNCNLTLL